MIISARHIIKSFQIVGEKKATVLDGLNFEINEGEFVALMGPSGVGKSTFLYLLGTLDKPDAGEINFNIDDKNYDIVNLSESNLSKLRNSLLGFVFQFHQLLPEFTAIENVIMPALIKGVNKKNGIEKAKKLLDRVGMSHRLNNKPSELSGGEQQRIAIARALMNNPKIILADEPTGNLDAVNSKAVLELISSIRKEYKLTCIVATHSQEVANYADRICTLGDGIILKEERKIVAYS